MLEVPEEASEEVPENSAYAVCSSWNDFPFDLLLMVNSYLPFKDFKRLEMTYKQFYDVQSYPGHYFRSTL